MQKSYRNLAVISLIVAVIFFTAGRALRHTEGMHARPDWLVSLTGARGIGSNPARTFAAVLDSLEASYVDRIDNEKPLTYGALRSLVDELDDPDSRFLDPNEARDVVAAQDGELHGIGAVVDITGTKAQRRLVVANVLPDSPAQQAGLKAGDVILRIDDKWVFEYRDGMKEAARGSDPSKATDVKTMEDPRDAEDVMFVSSSKALQALAEDGRTVTLGLKGRDAKILDKVVIRSVPTAIRTVELTQPEPGTASLRIGGFTRTLGPELDAAIEEARGQGAKDLVIDLRGCVGGPLDRALQAASRFTSGPVGLVERRSGEKTARQTLTVQKTANAWTGPIAVIVDKTTIGTAEVLAAALTSKGRGTLIGERTFGDGLEQSLIPLKDGSALMLTTGKYFMTNGQSFHAQGLNPSVMIATASDQVPAALRVLHRNRG